MLFRSALDQLGVTLEASRQRVGELVGPGAEAGTDSPSFTPRAKKVMELALKEALQLDHSYIGTEHLLLGLVREGQGVAAQVLVGYADMIEVRKKVIKLLREQPPGTEVRGVRSGGWVSHAPGEARILSCSFCGRRSPETGRLGASGRAAICEHCIRDWHGRLEHPEQQTAPAPQAHLVEPYDEGSTEDQ